MNSVTTCDFKVWFFLFLSSSRRQGGRGRHSTEEAVQRLICKWLGLGEGAYAIRSCYGPASSSSNYTVIMRVIAPGANAFLSVCFLDLSSHPVR